MRWLKQRMSIWKTLLKDFSSYRNENIAYEDIYESLLLLYANKIDLNKTTKEELESLYLLSQGQLNNFFNHLDKNGALLSIHELQTIPGFDLETIRALQPFVLVDQTRSDTRPFFQRLLSEENNYLLLRLTRRLERQLGYGENPDSTKRYYLGSPYKIYGRYRVSHLNDFSLGITFEKDPGEQISFDSSQKGFDFYSAHLLLENKLGLDKLVIGDYQLQLGQGLLLGAGFTSGKGAETVNALKRNSLGLRPYTSVLESGFFRGAGLTKSFGDFESTIFYSRLKQDGNIQFDDLNLDDDLLDEIAFAHSIRSGGYHRTQNEIENKDKILEENFGFVMNYRPVRRLKIGVAGLNTNYSIPIIKTPNQLQSIRI